MLYPNDTNTNTRYVICISRVYVMFNTNEQPTMRIGPNVIMVEMLGLDIFEALSARHRRGSSDGGSSGHKLSLIHI